MAEGRMLKKVICESPRLAALKSDTNRLIYTWLIPHLDVEGRHSADIRILKSHIAPILDHITSATIRHALIDMAENDLVDLYDVDGKPCLELKRFHKHQVLREGREKPSEIPPSSVGTPSVLRRPSVGTARQEKLREVKISKASAREELPVDNSIPPPPLPDDEPDTQDVATDPEKRSLKKTEKPKPQNTHGERWTEKQGEDLEALMTDIKERYGSRYHQEVYTFVQTNFNKKNPDAVLHCLQRLIRDRLAGKSIPIPGRWLDAALNGNGKDKAGENPKFEARESERIHADKKDEEERDIARLVGGIGRSVR